MTIAHIYNSLVAGKRKKGFLKFLTRLSANVMIYILAMTSYPSRKQFQSREKKIVISLTSFPARIGQLWKVIETLLRQEGNLPPIQVVLWLSEEQFASRESLPKRLLRQEKAGLQIRIMPDDLKPHKKYYYAFQEYSDDIVVTVDDDVLYPLDLVAKLYASHLQHPESVCCNRGRIIPNECEGDSNDFPSYLNWKIVHNTTDLRLDNKILPTGVGAVLYPPHCYDERIFDLKAIKETCLVADDLWLNFMCRLHGTSIVHSPNDLRYVTLFTRKKQSLFKSNVDQSQNDRQIKLISQWANKELGMNFFQNNQLKK